jgi:hypothetical protein
LIQRIICNVGSGFNEYDTEKKQIRVFRLGFLGKRRYFECCYSFSKIDALFLENRNSFFQPNLYLILKKKQKVPLTQFGSVDFRSIQEIEYFSANLAQFLKIPLKREL